jgi:hypothetical protein
MAATPITQKARSSTGLSGIHPAHAAGRDFTRVGDDCLVSFAAHIAYEDADEVDGRISVVGQPNNTWLSRDSSA